ncbi:MAG: Shedu immune nuclease family protein [Xanthobacteraceae bacterium]
MPCKACEKVEDVTDDGGLYIVRECDQCGRKIKIREPGKHGIGVKIRKGDQVVMPAEWLAISANPLKSRGHLSKHGVGWFAQLVFTNDLGRQKDLLSVIAQMDDQYGEVLKGSPLLAEYNIEDAEQSEAVFNKLKANQDSPEWWLYVAGSYLSISKDAIEKGDAQLAAWAMACAERYRALYVFKVNFEEVVWMGQSAKRLTDLLTLWDANKANSDEGFWQIQFQAHSLALSQLFSVPVTLIDDKAYVGGQGIDRRDARFVDFLFSGGSGSEAILVEIKTPVTPLMLKTPYRTNVFVPSSHLSGSVVQIADYRVTLSHELAVLTQGKYELSAFHPRCVVIIGNSAQLDTDQKRRSFELFRSNLSNVEVVTFDEVFRKVEHLASLFNLVRTNASTITS